MGVIPAAVAGVDHVSVATPPAEEINPVTLAAIHEAGADAVYQVGGAQAIAALAYGTETVTNAQKVVGPGNKWVTAAKAIVQGDVEIDFLAGPSEVLVLADETADPDLVASDLIAQAEHDPNASVVAVTDDAALAEAVAEAVDEQVAGRKREETIRAALDNDASGVLHARSMPEAVLFTEEYAAEHLSIAADDDEALLARISNAGSVFLGAYSPSPPATTQPGRTTCCRRTAAQSATAGSPSTPSSGRRRFSDSTATRSTGSQRRSRRSRGGRGAGGARRERSEEVRVAAV